MTRNQKMAIEIMQMLDSKSNTEVGYYTVNDSVVFCDHSNKPLKIIDIFSFMDNAEAQRRFDEIKSIIEELKANAN